ncbi:hypothetical protein [Streptomyces sp. NPDC047046]|uniref:hypothetical protein n=1 Tax=Streptomyces sp. NPDC047046 TaxID=3155378 RepID=UPI0033F769B6
MSLLCVPRRQGKTINAARRTTLVVATSAALALTGIAACGTVEDLSAAQKIQKAADKLGEQNALKVEFGLDADPRVLQRLTAEDDPADKMSATAAKNVSKLRVAVTVQATKPLAEAEQDDMKSVAVTLGSGKGAELLDLRMIDKTLYLRADLDQLGKTFDSPLPADSKPPAGMGAISDLFEGKWVKTSTEALKGAAGEKDKSDEELDPKTVDKLKTDLSSIVTRRVTFTDKGEKDGTRHILAKAPARALLSDVLGAVRDVSDKLPAGTLRGMPSDKDLKDVPNKKIGVDFGIEDGRLSGLTFDTTQLAEPGDGIKKTDKLDVVLRFTDPGKVVAPSDATEMPKGKNGAPFGLDPEALLNGSDMGEAFDEDSFKNDPAFRQEFEKQLRKEMDKQFGADWENGPMGDEIEKQIQAQLKLQFGDSAAKS